VTAGTPRSRRLHSVDALRGLTVAGMITVNNPGSWSHVYAPLEHADWHGCTPTDLVFPFFLFTVGVSIHLAFTRARQRGDTAAAVLRKVTRRTVVLFALGLLLASFPFVGRDLASIRIPGVLQRIAVCYGAAALLFWFTNRRTQVVVWALSLLGYWAVMSWVPVPGHGAGQIDGKDTHLAAYLDRLLLGGHLWSQAKTWDPEGVLSTVPALATTLCGVFAGGLVSDPKRWFRLVPLGVTWLVLGWLWGLWFPINKAIWTSSYAIYTAGMAAVCLAVCVWWIDVRGHVRWARPLEIFGINAITVFVGSGLLGRLLHVIRIPQPGGGDIALKTWLYDRSLASWLAPYPASLAYALCWVAGWFALLWWMDRRGWVIKV